MFAALEAIKNTLFAFTPLPSTVVRPMDTITSVIDDDVDDADSITEPIIDKPDPIPKESEQVDVFDKHPYTVKNLVSGEPEDFHYLHGENLAQSYDFCLNKGPMIKIHICMVAMDFQCNYSGEHLPFLRFLMEYGSSSIDFPKCEIICNAEGDAYTDDAKMSEMDTYFHNECKKRLLDFFAIEEQSIKIGDIGKLLNKSYRGYKEIGGGGIVVVFDITDFLNIPLRPSANPAWVVLDDFIEPVLPFSPKVLQFFREAEYMKQIRDPLNNLVEPPKSLYLYDTTNSRFMMKSEKSEWLEPRSFHPTYGDFYFFKQLTIGHNENAQVLNTYRKCVVFLKNYADFLENDESIALSGERISESAKSVGGSSDIDVDDLELSEDSEDEELDLSKSEYTKTEIQNNLPFVSLIMFSEKGEPVYCAKTESIFKEL
uniref:Uncharacterized protein n=1 Tax=viral metagenome TaxID=1070528 RepID=A0A6C0HHY7_9ZZZZ